MTEKRFTLAYEKSKGSQVTTELINEIKDELLTLHGKEIPINYNNKYRDENFKFNYYALIKKLNEALIKYDKIQELENDVKHWKNGYLIVSQNNNEQYDKIEELKTLVDFYKDFQKDARELAKKNAILKEENEELISMNNDLAKALLKDVEFTEEDFQQAWEEYKEEIKNKPFSELFKEMIGGKKND